MNIKNYILIASLACACSSCELLQPNEIINPNVDEDTFLKTPNAMSTWVNGANRSFATIIGSYVELTEISPIIILITIARVVRFSIFPHPVYGYRCNQFATPCRYVAGNGDPGIRGGG